MTSQQIRQSFLDFFKSKEHTIVPSSSLMPDSPGLLFTNAGMNQFVPIFLNQKQPDVSKWAGAVPGLNTRAADTQKCIRAGGKHNDLEDVGLDTYHHTFFEMLGNWSFGDYFKKEAIEWAWELVVKAWHFPPQRLYATVFCPYLGEPGWEAKWQTELEQVLVLAMTSANYIPPTANASPFEIADQEAAMFWAKKFTAAGLNPKVHIIPGNKKDNFWMMGETGPCGPCSELHMDLTPAGDTRGLLVNQGDARCIEIWNLVFIQFNANPDGIFAPLPAKHVDTGMGFERVTSIIQGTKGLTDFANAKISNYETDIFRPIFDVLEKLSGKKYGSTLPGSSGSGAGVPPATRPAVVSAAETVTGTVAGSGRRDACPTTEQIALDIAFRVIADHIRTLSFAIADGIQPGNTDRKYVLRRILRRAVRYGRTLGFHEPFFYKLVDVLADTMGDVFPEIRAKKKHVQEVIRTEEEVFNKTVDEGMELERQIVEAQADWKNFAVELEKLLAKDNWKTSGTSLQSFRTFAYGRLVHEEYYDENFSVFFDNLFAAAIRVLIDDNDIRSLKQAIECVQSRATNVSGNAVFVLYDTFGFPPDLTTVIAKENGLTVDEDGYREAMEKQRSRSRAAQKKEVISLSQIETTTPTKFVGFDKLETEAKVVEVVSLKDKTAVILDTSACYAEMGGQVGDTGEILLSPVAADVSRLTSSIGADSRPLLRITNTQKSGNTWLHFVEGENIPAIGDEVVLRVEAPRRNAIQRHHTVTHLLHWALHEVVSKEASQKGSFVGSDKLTFDFNSAPLTPAQVADIEKLVNERILENAGVSWTEVPYADVKSRKDVMQFFGDKYGDIVRVVQVGGRAGELNGYSMELCGGTHTRATGEIGLFRIVGENAIAAGVRRIEAIAGLTAYDVMKLDRELIKTVAGKVNSPIHELEKKIESLLEQQKVLEKEVKLAMLRNASNAASELLERVHTVNDIPLITHNLGDANGDFLQAIADALKGRFKGVVVLGGASGGAVALVATVSPEFTTKVQAGKLIQQIAPIVGGKGGGKPDNARGGGKDANKLDEALAKVRTLLS